MTGSLVEIEMKHIDNPEAQRELRDVTTGVAGGVGYPERT
jgi:hypothetical protein